MRYTIETRDFQFEQELRDAGYTVGTNFVGTELSLTKTFGTYTVITAFAPLKEIYAMSVDEINKEFATAANSR